MKVNVWTIGIKNMDSIWQKVEESGNLPCKCNVLGERLFHVGLPQAVCSKNLTIKCQIKSPQMPRNTARGKGIRF